MGCCGGRSEAPRRDVPGAQRTANTAEDPLEILKMRLAKGEITVEEYEQLATILSR